MNFIFWHYSNREIYNPYFSLYMKLIFTIKFELNMNCYAQNLLSFRSDIWYLLSPELSFSKPQFSIDNFYTRQYWFVLKAFVTKLIHELNFWHIYNSLLGTQKIPLHWVKLFTYFTTNDLLFNNNEKIRHDLKFTISISIGYSKLLPLI